MGTGCFATPKTLEIGIFFFLPKSVASCSCQVIVFREGHFRNGATNVCSPHRPVQLITISAHKKTRDKRLKERDGAVGGMLSWRNAIFCLQPKGHQTASPPPPPTLLPGVVSAPPGHVGRADTSSKSLPASAATVGLHIPNVHHRHKSTS